MLNKKGFALPSHWMLFGVALILMVAGLIFISYVDSAYSYKVSLEKSDLLLNDQDIEAIDTQFMDLDLINILKLEVEDYTLGEILSYTDQNYPTITNEELFNGLLIQHFSDRLSCDETLYNAIDDQLRPVFNDDWYLSIYDLDNEMIFFCTAIPLFDNYPVSTEILIPSQDPERELRVVLEVYE
tara:strand:+ start:133 stop:684 length:552 start_codon:yes stop_codon:yes gene_type:complete